MFIEGKLVLGKTSLSKAITDVMEGGVDELAGAIYEEMNEIKTASQEIVPYESGTLQSSADVVGVNILRTGSGGQVVIGYGGAAAEYTFAQHQTPPPGEGEGGELEFRHAPGRTWKFLERPTLAAIEGMEGRIGNRIRLRMAAR